MSCNEIRVNLPAYIRNELSAAEHDRMAAHLAACEECREAHASEYVLNDALQERFVIPPPSPDFQKRVLAAARGNTDTDARWGRPVMGGAIAAALALGIGLGVLLQPTGLTEEPTSRFASPDSVVENPSGPVSAPVDKTVRLAFRSGEALENVTLTLELPPHVELVSWPGHHQLSWQVSLDAGDNVLSLPLRLLFPGAGELVARLDTGDRQKTFRAPIPEYPVLPVEDPES